MFVNNQQTLAFLSRITTSQVWAIVEIIASTLNPIISSCVLNRHHGYWLLNDALANAINLCVKLTNKKFELEIQMNFIPPFQCDAKSILLTKTM
jgi:hypothetical protein